MLAGCVGTPQENAGDEEDPVETQRPEVLPWGLEECRYIVSFGWVDGDRLSPYLPEGYVPRPDPQAPDPEADTWFGFDLMTCASGVGLNGTVAPVEFGFLWAAADPPEVYLQDDVPESEHYPKWDVLVPDAERRSALAARGVPVRTGSATIAQTGPVLDGALTLDGLGTFTVTAVPAVERTSPFEGSFAKISTAEDGAAVWRASANSGERMSGWALLSFEAGSWPTDVIGGDQLVGQFHSGTWSYTDAEIRFVELQGAR